MPLRNESSISLGLPAAPVTQDPELATELTRVYNAIRSVARAVDMYMGALGEQEEFWDQSGTGRMFSGLNSKFYAEAGDPSISPGNTIGLGSNGKAYRAYDAGYRCCGYAISVVGGWVEIQVYGLSYKYPPGTLTPGAVYYNSTTAGIIGVAGSAPTWNQAIGYALNDTQLFFMPQL